MCCLCLLAELWVFGRWRESFVKSAKVMRPGSHVIQLKTADRGSAPKLMEKKVLHFKELKDTGFYQDWKTTLT